MREPDSQASGTVSSFGRTRSSSTDPSFRAPTAIPRVWLPSWASIEFATELGARLVAEGIETDAERSALLAIGVRFGQGYLFGRAASVETWSTGDSA